MYKLELAINKETINMAKKAQKMEIGQDLVTDFTGPFTTAQGELLSNYMEIEPEAPVVEAAPVVEEVTPVVEATPVVEEVTEVSAPVTEQAPVVVTPSPVAIPVRLVGKVKG